MTTQRLKAFRRCVVFFNEGLTNSTLETIFLINADGDDDDDNIRY